MLTDGFHDVPGGKIAMVVTSLQMPGRPASRAQVEGPWSLRRLSADREAYRDLYRKVGQDWMWFSRVVMADAELDAILCSPRVEAYALEVDGVAEGLLELDFRHEGECELVYFGLTADLIGGGAGRWMMNRAIEKAWAAPITRFWVHTCTLDHPNAPGFYMRSGFVPFRRQIEIADDPRLTGHAPMGAAAHVPIIRP